MSRILNLFGGNCLLGVWDCVQREDIGIERKAAELVILKLPTCLCTCYLIKNFILKQKKFLILESAILEKKLSTLARAVTGKDDREKNSCNLKGTVTGWSKKLN
jgi:hypothetical protein